MTFRDANAHPMTDYFDFRKPAFAKPPALAAAPALAPGLAECHAHGLNPPLSGRACTLTSAPGAAGYSAVRARAEDPAAPAASPGRGSGRGAAARSPAAGGIGTSGGGGASAPNTSSSVPPSSSASNCSFSIVSRLTRISESFSSDSR